MVRSFYSGNKVIRHEAIVEYPLTEDVSEVLNKLGITVFDNDGVPRDFGNVLEEIAEKFQCLLKTIKLKENLLNTTGERLNTLEQALNFTTRHLDKRSSVTDEEIKQYLETALKAF